MAVACEVRRTVAKNARDVHLVDFRLEFKEPKLEDPETVRQRELAASKSRWFQAVGLTDGQ